MVGSKYQNVWSRQAGLFLVLQTGNLQGQFFQLPQGTQGLGFMVYYMLNAAFHGEILSVGSKGNTI
jgi:hypothetical protein